MIDIQESKRSVFCRRTPDAPNQASQTWVTPDGDKFRFNVDYPPMSKTLPYKGLEQPAEFAEKHGYTFADDAERKEYCESVLKYVVGK